MSITRFKLGSKCTFIDYLSSSSGLFALILYTHVYNIKTPHMYMYAGFTVTTQPRISSHGGNREDPKERERESSDKKTAHT